jgi:trans-aconitate methyltransferase
VSLDHFVTLYEAKDDPWDNATKWSDQRKYAIAAASLPRAHYRRAYEPGCAVGELTRLLASRCDEILATDAVEAAVRQAQDNVHDLENVRVSVASLPRDLPEGPFDLIVVGDLLYYLSAPDQQATINGLVDSLEPDGDLLAVHFRNRDQTGAYDGHNAHALITAHPSLTPLIHHDDEWFLLTIWRRIPS